MNAEWMEAIRRGDVPALAAFLAEGADVDARDGHGQTALMLAARAGALPVVALLLDHRADPDVAAKYGLSALMLAIVAGHGEVAHCLVEAGADLALTGTGAPGFAGKTALDLARERGLDGLVADLAARMG